jgi:uncharacterized protein YjbI with pentapeptide repeats
VIQIKRWTDGKVLYTAEGAADVKAALEEAVKAKADLRYADLGYADLRYADLRYADLRYADLRYADLRYADLRYADLRYADLRYADLRSADLRYANLGYADLGYADLRSADLRSADLRYADLDYSHPLWAFWTDFVAVLDRVPAEAAGLRAAIAEGNIDGSVYEGACACLVGTIANVRHVSFDELDIGTDASRPAEQWFMPIRKGDVPIDDPKQAKSEGVFRASVALQWLDEWVELRKGVAQALVAGTA